MVEIFDAQGVSFVAVTQQFNTTTSMGRLTLNVLLSFAQFEREVAGERIRDKIAASKQKGMWMGGFVPLGYTVCDRRIVIDEGEAESVRYIFRRYQELGCVRLLKDDLDRHGILSKQRTSKGSIESGGHSFSRGALYALLSNPIYVGEIRHKNLCHPGQHQAILDRAMWERTQQQLGEHRVRSKIGEASIEKSPLTGRLVDENGDGLTPSHARKGERKYRYYVSRNFLAQGSAPSRVGWRLPARELEERVAAAVREMLDDQASVLEAAQKTDIDSPKSTGYSTRHAPGATAFNQKPNERPRLPRSWTAWNSNVTAWACRSSCPWQEPKSLQVSFRTRSRSHDRFQCS
jgi:site-specific DNA recombinase